jgi:hypothetical protein
MAAGPAGELNSSAAAGVHWFAHQPLLLVQKTASQLHTLTTSAAPSGYRWPGWLKAGCTLPAALMLSASRAYAWYAALPPLVSWQHRTTNPLPQQATGQDEDLQGCVAGQAGCQPLINCLLLFTLPA